jgi:protein-tyrosine phosphatase
MIKVLFVCLGNICRSPLAEGIFRKLVDENGLGNLIYYDSAGTSDYHIGEDPDPRTVKNALKNGVILSHKGRQFKKRDFAEFDYVLAMDRSNHMNILKLNGGGEILAKLYLMREFDPADDGTTEVPDPYFGGEEGFQLVFDILKRSNEQFLDYLIREHNIK